MNQHESVKDRFIRVVKDQVKKAKDRGGNISIGPGGIDPGTGSSPGDVGDAPGSSQYGGPGGGGDLGEQIGDWLGLNGEVGSGRKPIRAQFRDRATANRNRFNSNPLKVLTRVLEDYDVQGQMGNVSWGGMGPISDRKYAGALSRWSAAAEAVRAKVAAGTATRKQAANLAGLDAAKAYRDQVKFGSTDFNAVGAQVHDAQAQARLTYRMLRAKHLGG